MTAVVNKECGRCGKSYQVQVSPGKYYRRYCSPECSYMRKGTPEERFMSKIEKAANGCWLWKGEITNEGYGRMWLHGRMQSAHRYMHEWKIGPIPADKIVMHSCDVRHCVNPAHLGLGTTQDNADDKVRKGRSQKGRNRLDENVRAAIMALLKINASPTKIAETVGVANKTVRKYAKQSQRDKNAD